MSQIDNKRTKLLVTGTENADASVRLQRERRMTLEALADVDAGRVVDHQSVRTFMRHLVSGILKQD